MSATLPPDQAETLRTLHARLPVARAEAQAIRDAARGALVAELERLHAPPPDGPGIPYAAMARALGISGQALHDLRTGRARP